MRPLLPTVTYIDIYCSINATQPTYKNTCSRLTEGKYTTLKFDAREITLVYS